MTERWEKVRFFISLAVCLGVIIGAAFWAYALRNREAPAAAVGEAAGLTTGAGEMVEETAAEAAVLCRPVAGAIVRDYAAFGWDVTLDCFGPHQALDLAAERGQAVGAALEGTVTFARRDRLWGGVVEITAEDGSVCRYAALEWPAAVREGQRVAADETVGFAGVAPCEAALPSHVHFAFFCEGTAREPLFE